MQRSFRAVFISDVHLGTPACQAQHLLDFLECVSCRTLYLVGDIIDLEHMKSRAHFTDTHHKIISLIMEKARSGTEVIYIPGNHDAFFRQLAGQTISGIKIRKNTLHRTADNRSFHVSHGDEFDHVVQISPLALLVGEKAHDSMLWLNGGVNKLRKAMHLPYWSLAGYIKENLGKAQQFIGRFEQAALQACRSLQVDGYICGHIHYASFNRQSGVLYCNDGDWVEHCTALVETFQGELKLMHWSEQPRWIASEPEEEINWQPIPAAS
ncbi:MAG: UDP-2,3-diacylglucosamine diphosphatase [Hahellaceae bacterium]|nr:UDP-2,3-diacylglucosamine diphosphatase [Hahellaceae bacterium]